MAANSIARVSLSQAVPGMVECVRPQGRDAWFGRIRGSNRKGCRVGWSSKFVKNTPPAYRYSLSVIGPLPPLPASEKPCQGVLEIIVYIRGTTRNRLITFLLTSLLGQLLTRNPIYGVGSRTDTLADFSPIHVNEGVRKNRPNRKHRTCNPNSSARLLISLRLVTSTGFGL